MTRYRCSTCLCLKTAEEMGVDRRAKGGVQRYCKACRVQRKRESRLAARDGIEPIPHERVDEDRREGEHYRMMAANSGLESRAGDLLLKMREMRLTAKDRRATMGTSTRKRSKQ